MSHPIVKAHRSRLVTGAVIASLLAGCVATPRLSEAPRPKPAASYAAARSFDAPVADWTPDRWWAGYGDEQLESLVDEALADAPDLAQARARVRQADALAQQAGAALGPQINGSAAAIGIRPGDHTGLPASILKDGWNGLGWAGASLAYQFDFFGRNRAALAAATSEAEASRADVATAGLALAGAVANAYAVLDNLHADRDAAADALRIRAHTEVLVRQRAAYGLDDESTLQRALSRRAAAEAQLTEIDTAIGLTRNRLAALLGKGPDRGLTIVRPTLAASRRFGLPVNLQLDLIGRRPDVVAARLRVEAAAQKVKVVKADFYPNVNLVGFLGIQSLGLDTLLQTNSLTGVVGPSLSLPIFRSGQLQGAYRGARADYDSEVAAYDQTLVRALNQVADAAISTRALDTRLAKRREALGASERAFDLTRQRYARGLGSYLDVLTAEAALIASRREVADLHSEAFGLDVALIAALGGGYEP